MSQPLLELVGHLGLDVAAGEPGLEEVRVLAQVEEVVLRVVQHRGRAGDQRARLAELGGVVGGAAGLAVVAVLVVLAAVGTGALHEPVGQEHPALGVVELLHRAGEDQPRVLEARIDQLGTLAVFFRVGRVVVVVVDQETREVARVGLAHLLDQRFRRGALLLGLEHGRRAVGIVGADVGHLMAPQALETHPDVGLDVLEEVAQVDVAVGVGQSAGDEDSTGHGIVDKVASTCRSVVGSNRGSDLPAANLRSGGRGREAAPTGVD